jgi:hypothetical protein
VWTKYTMNPIDMRRYTSSKPQAIYVGIIAGVLFSLCRGPERWNHLLGEIKRCFYNSTYNIHCHVSRWWWTIYRPCLFACSKGALAFIKGPATGVDEAARTEGVGTATETEMAATAGERL